MRGRSSLKRPTGNVTFELWDNRVCSTANGGKLLFSQTVALDTNGNAHTDETQPTVNST
jgi:hypothetical protein